MRRRGYPMVETRTGTEKIAASHGVDLERETDPALIRAIKQILWGKKSDKNSDLISNRR